MTNQDYLDYIEYVQANEIGEEDMFTKQMREQTTGGWNTTPQILSYGQWLAGDGDYKTGSQYPYTLSPSRGDALRAIKRGYLEVPEIETGSSGDAETPSQMVDTRNFWGSLKPGEKVTVDKNGWYQVPEDADSKNLRIPSGSYVNIITGRYSPSGEGKPTSPYSGKAMDYDTSVTWQDYMGMVNKSIAGGVGEPGGSNRGKFSELEGLNWFIGKVAAMGAGAAGGGWENAGSGIDMYADPMSFDPSYVNDYGYTSTNAGTGIDPYADPQSYDTSFKSNYSPDIDWGNVGTSAAKQVVKGAVGYGIDKLASGLDATGGGTAGGTRTISGTGLTGITGESLLSDAISSSFDVADTPLSTEFAENEKIIDELLEKAGETGNYETAVEAVNSFQTIAANRTELEKEIQKLKSDPDFEAIEPEIRATTEEAIQKGMTPKQATAYAFERAKKEREHSEFLKEYQMRKKLELAGLSGEEGDEEAGVLNSFDGAGYGLRPSGAVKGQGWLGPLPMTDGSGRVATELTITVDDREIPLIVPTLSKKEIDSLLAGEKPTRTIINKAIEFAEEREKQGFSVYADPISWGDKVIRNKGRGYKGQEKMWPDQTEGVNSLMRLFTPQYSNEPNDAMVYDPKEIQEFLRRYKQQGVSL